MSTFSLMKPVKHRCASEDVSQLLKDPFRTDAVKDRTNSDATVCLSEISSTEQSTPADSPVDPSLLLGERMAQKSMLRIQQYLNLYDRGNDSEINWSLQVSKQNMLVFTSVSKNTCWNAIKAVTVMKATMKNLLNLLLVDSRMGEYDEMFDRHEPIHESSVSNIRRVLYKGVWPTTPRDFIICTTHEVQPDGSVLIATISAPDTLYPQQKDYVRGNIHISGYHIQPYSATHAIHFDGPKCNPLQPGECKVTLVAHTELGGSLPASIINCLSTNAPVKILSQIADIMKRTAS